MTEVKFTVGFVNYKTSIYMNTQLAIYQNYAGQNCKIIILDNSENENELHELENIKANFPKMTIEIIKNNPCGKVGSYQHGEGLQKIYEMVDTEYFLPQDPDFFWVFPDFLTFFEKKLQDSISIGAPYHMKDKLRWIGAADFPVGFGSTYHVSKLKEIDADWHCADTGRNRRDVGWKVYRDLAKYPYYAFEYRTITSHFGPANYLNNGSIHGYYDSDRLVAIHLTRGSFEDLPDNVAVLSKEDRSNLLAPNQWQENRQKFCEFALELIQG